MIENRDWRISQNNSLIFRLILKRSGIVLKKEKSPEKIAERIVPPPKVNLPENVQQRNKKMFSSILTHLQKAKNILEHDKTLVNI